MASREEKRGTSSATPIPTILSPTIPTGSSAAVSVAFPSFPSMVVLPSMVALMSSRSVGKRPGGREITRIPSISTVPMAVLEKKKI